MAVAQEAVREIGSNETATTGPPEASRFSLWQPSFIGRARVPLEVCPRARSHRRDGCRHVSAGQPVPALLAAADLRRRQEERQGTAGAEPGHVSAAASVLPPPLREAAGRGATRWIRAHPLEG